MILEELSEQLLPILSPFQSAVLRAQSKDIPVRDELENTLNVYEVAAADMYGYGYDYRARFNSAGLVDIFQVLTIVESVTDPRKEVSLMNVSGKVHSAKVGYLVLNPLKSKNYESSNDVNGSRFCSVRSVTLEHLKKVR